MRPLTSDPMTYRVLGQFDAMWQPILPHGTASPVDRDYGLPVADNTWYVSCPFDLSDTLKFPNVKVLIDDLLYRVNALESPPAPGAAGWATVETRYAFRVEDPVYQKSPPGTLIRVKKYPF